MNTIPSHFLVYDDMEQTWKPTTLEELSMRNDPDLYVVPIYENNQQGEQCTWQDWPEQQKARDLKLKEQQEEERRKAEANKPNIYEYEVIEHTKYKGLLAEYDSEGLKEKINDLAKKGYRLVSASNIVTSAHTSLQGIVAIMEKVNK